jgi:hypothetical protein
VEYVKEEKHIFTFADEIILPHDISFLFEQIYL